MQIKLHKLAKITPTIRECIWNEIYNKKRIRKELVKELHLNVATVQNGVEEIKIIYLF